MPSRPPVHRPHGMRSEAERKQAYETRRLSASERGYGTRWQKARASYLAKHPLCVACKKEHHVEPATEVDHIIPHRGNQQLFWDQSNWQGLCKPHHSRKTATEDSGFARPGGG